MRILLVTDQLSSEGGAEAIVANLARGLDDRGHDVRICVSRLRPGNAPVMPRTIGIDVVPWAGEGAPNDPGVAAHALSIARDFAPDVVHFHNIFDRGVVDELRQAFPSAWTCHDHRANCPNGDRVYPHSRDVCELPMGSACLIKSATEGCVAGPRLRTVRALSRRRRLFASLSQCDAVAAPSRCVADILQTNGVDPARIAVTPLFTPYADARSAPPLPESPRAFFGARLVPQKGTEDVIWMAAGLRSASAPLVAVAGDGPQRPMMEAAAANGALTYLGFLDAEGMSRAYEASTVVIAAPRWIDPFPIVGIEALAFARPVVCYRRGGIAELIEDGVNGLVVAPNDRHAMLRAVEQLLEDRELAGELGRRGREVVRAGYRPKHGLPANESLYNEALRRRGKTPRRERCAIEIFAADSRSTHWPDALEVRLAVFVREQDVPFEAEEDGHDTADPTCVHALALTPVGRAAATGRLYTEDAQTARIGRMAVLPAFRGHGVGMDILDALLGEARRRGSRFVVLDSQTNAIDFYARRGFRPEGGIFDDCGIPHRRMRVELT